MKESESNSNHSNNNNLAMSVVVLTVVTIIFFLIYSGWLKQGIEFVQSHLYPKTNFVTYYQWTDEKGEMKISRDAPRGRDYITFEADENLQHVNYQVDADLIKQGKQVRDELLVNSHNNKQVLVQSSALQKARKLADNSAICTRISEEIRSLEYKLKKKQSAEDLDSYQNELRDAKWRKLKNKC